MWIATPNTNYLRKGGRLVFATWICNLCEQNPYPARDTHEETQHGIWERIEVPFRLQEKAGPSSTQMHSIQQHSKSHIFS